MSHIERRADPVQANRRTFLQGAALTAAGCSLGASELRSATSPLDEARPVSGIEPAEIVAEYRARNLAGLSDDELYRQVGAIVGTPCQGMTSFTLHSPLELLARKGLLPLVAPRDRELARMQMVASAAAYEAGTKRIDPVPAAKPFADLDAARGAFAAGFAAADAAGAEAVVRRMTEQFGTARTIEVLAPYSLASLAAAAHSHIGLWLLAKHGSESADTREAAFLIPAIRMVAEESSDRIRGFAGLKPKDEPLRLTPAQVELAFAETLASSERIEFSGGGIRPSLQAVEEAGLPVLLFGEWMAYRWSSDQTDAAFRSILRAGALSMLQDDPARAKFGWSHAFSLPQAACGLASWNASPQQALTMGTVSLSGFRALMSTRELDYAWQPERADLSLAAALHAGPQIAAARVWHAAPEERPAVWCQLASEASIRRDQHLVKYVRACMDAADFDPSRLRVYQAAAAFLAGVWIAEIPRANILEKPLEGRSTPA